MQDSSASQCSNRSSKRLRPSSSRPPDHLLESRDNFPPFEEALVNGKRNSGSVCSESSSLDLSIGTRAALYSHQRHVAKYGIDHDDDDCDDDYHRGSDDNEATTTTHEYYEHPQDEQWERILQGQVTISSPSTTLSPVNQANSSVSSTSSPASSETSLTDTSFFHNVSIAKPQLFTPERNLHLTKPSVTVRGEEDQDCCYSSSCCGSSPSSSSSSCDTLSSYTLLQRATNLAMHHLTFDDEIHNNNNNNDRDSLGSSSDGDHHNNRINALDVSGISQIGSDVSFQKQSPEEVAPSYCSRFVKEEDCDHESFDHLDSSKPVSGTTSGPYPTTTTSSHVQLAPYSPMELQAMCLSNNNTLVITEKENRHDNNNHHPTGLNNILTLSPIPSVTVSSFVGFPRSLDSLKRTMPEESPAIQEMHPSHASLASLKHSSFDNSDWLSIRNNLSASSLSSLEGRDRRQFRTVVPQRVFLDDPSEFPDHHDSFSAAVPPKLGNTDKNMTQYTDATSFSSPF